MKADLVRKLKEWRWELRGKKVALISKKTGNELILDKVRLMSFMKFAPNCLDKMRIEESKQLRLKIKKVKENFRERINRQRISARARKVKNG